MKNLNSILLTCILFFLISSKSLANVVFDEVNMILHVPASKAEHSLIVDFNNGVLSRIEQRNALTRIHSNQARKYVEKDMTDLQRAEVALEKINLLRQAGALTIKRIPTTRKLEGISYEYIIIHQDSEINTGISILYYGNIDLQLKYLATLLGAEQALSLDVKENIKELNFESLVIDTPEMSMFSYEKSDDEVDNERFNEWWDWVTDWLDGLPDNFSGQHIGMVGQDGDLQEWCGFYTDHQGETHEAHCAWW